MFAITFMERPKVTVYNLAVDGNDTFFANGYWCITSNGFVPIRQVGAGGIVTDQAPYDLELQQFPAGNNVAIEDGKIGKALGYSNRGP